MLPMTDAAGSSPLARGLLQQGLAPCARLGIIPARAGFTGGRGGAVGGVQDHPRSRGVYIARYASLPQAEGSSPLARGLPRGVM